jgi:hypothetical protein
MKVLGWTLTVIGTYETIGSSRGVAEGTLWWGGLVISFLVLVGGLAVLGWAKAREKPLHSS